MKSLKAEPSKLTSLSLMALMCTISPLAVREAYAQYQPNDACTAAETGFFVRAADDVPGPAIEGHHFIFCDGSNWRSFLQYNDASSAVFLRAPDSAPGDILFNNSHWSLWLDETNNQFELKARKSDGTIINSTVGLGGGGLWTDNTTHITYTGSAAHFINAGQTLPAGFDANGTRMFFYPDKEAFRGGEITGGNDAWQEANIGTHSFAWGLNNEASGNQSVAMGYSNTVSGPHSVALGLFNQVNKNGGVALGQLNYSDGYSAVAIGRLSTVLGDYSLAMGKGSVVTGRTAMAVGYYAESLGDESISLGHYNISSGVSSVSLGRNVIAGSGTALDGAGDGAFAFGLQTNADTTNRPTVTGDRAAVFFFDSNVANANAGYDFTASDRLGLVGGQLQIGETQAQGAAAGCIQFNEATDQMEWSHDCTTYNAFSNAAGLWTDNTTHITRESAHIIDAGQALPATLDDDGARMFYYPDKQAFRGGEITGGNDAWQEANIGTHSFAWGLNTEASGNYSVALGALSNASGRSSTAIGSGDAFGHYSFATHFGSAGGYGAVAFGNSFAGGYGAVALGSSSALARYTVSSGYSIASRGRAVALGSSIASGEYSMAIGRIAVATGRESLSLGGYAVAGNGQFNSGNLFADGSSGSLDETIGENSMAFGLIGNPATFIDMPKITGDRSAVFFFDSNVNGAMDNYDFTASDRLGLVGGQLQIGETQLQGALAGCIQFNPTTDQLEWSNDCTTYNAFGGGSSLWTDNTTYVTQTDSAVHLIKTGQTLPAVLDDDGTRMFFYPDKEAFRGGEITGGNDAWQEANIGTHSFAWGENAEAAGNFSVALGQNATAGGTHAIAMGKYATSSAYAAMSFGRDAYATGLFSKAMGLFSLASGSNSFAVGNYANATATNAIALGRLAYATGLNSIAFGTDLEATGREALAVGIDVSAAGENSIAFGLISDLVNPNTGRPQITGDRSAVFFFDSNTDGALDNYDFTASDRLGLVGGQLQIGETQAQGAAAGCIQFNPTTDQLEWSNDCTTYNAFGGGASLWTDNTTHITRENFNIIDAGQTLPAGFDADGSRAFYYTDKQAFRGGEITGGNDAWQEANIGNNSFAWGQNAQASGIGGSVAMGGGSTATGNVSTAIGWLNTASAFASTALGSNNLASGYRSLATGYFNTTSGSYSTALGAFSTANGPFSTVIGINTVASGDSSIAFGRNLVAGSGTALDGAGDGAMAFGLQTASQATLPVVTGDRSAVFFFDGNTANANSTYDFTESDRLGLVGGQLQIGETQAQGALAGCIQFNPTTDQLEWSNDCTTYNAFGGGSSLWTDNTTYVTQTDSAVHLIKTGQTLPAVLDDDGTRMFFYPDKEAFRGGEITGGNDAWQEANIGTHSFAWGLNVEAAGNYSVAMGGGNQASANYSFVMGYANTASGSHSFAVGYSNLASAYHAFAQGYQNNVTNMYSTALGSTSTASGFHSHTKGALLIASGNRAQAFGRSVTVGSGTSGDGAGDNSMGFGLQEQNQATRPQITGDRSAVFFFDGGVLDANSTYDFTASDRLGLVGGQLQIGETQLQGAGAGCIQFNPTTDQLEWSNDCTTYNAFGGGSSLWTDNTTHITREDLNIIDAGQTLPAGFDGDGSRAFYYPDKEAFRGGEITGGNDAWQEANIGTHSFAWGLNTEASGNFSVAMGAASSATGLNSFAVALGTASGGYSTAMGISSVASGSYSTAMGFGALASGNTSFAVGDSITASGSRSVAMGYGTTASGLTSIAIGRYSYATETSAIAMGAYNSASGTSSIALGRNNQTTGRYSLAVGKQVLVGSGIPNDGNGEASVGFGLQTGSYVFADIPQITAQRSAVFFFDGGVNNANDTYDFTESDRLGLVGGQLQIGETQAQGAAAGCIQFNPTTDQLEWSNDCTTYNAFGGGASLWTDNTTYVTQTDSAVHLIKTGQTLPAVLDDDGTRMFFYPDKEAFRGGEITGGNDAWQEANIGTHSFAWGLNSQASGNYSLATGFGNTASGAYSSSIGGATNDASGSYSVAMGVATTASGYGSFAAGTFGASTGNASFSMGRSSIAAGARSIAMGDYAEALGTRSIALGRYSTASGSDSVVIGARVFAGSGTAGDGTGDNSMAFGLVSSNSHAPRPYISGDRSAVFFFDQNTVDSLENYNFTASDRLGLVGGQLQIGETQAQGAAAGCIQFNPTSDQLEWSNDCTTYNAFGGGASLWTDNTTHITRENFNIIDAGQTLPAGFDADGSRMFFYPDKEAFRGGEITGGNDAWQEANIGIRSFAWGENAEASGSQSVAMGRNATASGSNSVAIGTGVIASGSNGSTAFGWDSYAQGRSSFTAGAFNNAQDFYTIAMGYVSQALDNYSLSIGWFNTSDAWYSNALGYASTANAYRSTTLGSFSVASGYDSIAFGKHVVTGAGAKNNGAGSSAMAFGLQTNADTTNRPTVTGDRAAVFFFDSNVANANDLYDFTATDRLGLVGGQLQIGETQAQGALAGCIQFNPTTDQLEWSNDCTTYNAFGGGSSLWTDNTTYVTQADSAVHLIKTGQTLPAVLDDDGTRMFFYPDKEAFRGGEITSGNDAWQEANIGTHSFAWGQNAEASGSHSFAGGNYSTANGNYSTALGASLANGNHSVALGYSSASGDRSVALGYSSASGDNSTSMNEGGARGSHSTAMGTSIASGNHSFSMGRDVVSGSGTGGDGAGDSAVAFGLQTANQATDPTVTGDRTAAFVFDGGVADANSGIDITADDALIVYGGQVGIGKTTTPDEALDVVGNIQYTGMLIDLSDRRLKENIAELTTGQLQKIIELQGVSFNMKEDADKRMEFGLIAQDVLEVYPELVYENSDGILSVSYVGLIAPMAEAMEEQNNEIKAQAARIETQNFVIQSQKNRMDLLEEKLRALEEKIQTGATVHGLILSLLAIGF